MQVLERDLQGAADAPFIDVAHVEHREVEFVHESPLARIDTANADLAYPLRPHGRGHAVELRQLRGTEAAQAGDRHAVQTSARTQLARIEVSVRIEPDHPQRAPDVAATARDRRHRADAETVVAAQENGQAAGAELIL